MTEKPCGKCGEVLPLSEFGICRSRPDGRNLYCPKCTRAKVYASRQKLREIEKARKEARQLCLLNPDRKPLIVWKPQIKSPVQKVREAIQAGCHTREEISSHSKLSLDDVGDVLALLLDKRQVMSMAGVERTFYLREEAA